MKADNLSALGLCSQRTYVCVDNLDNRTRYRPLQINFVILKQANILLYFSHYHFTPHPLPAAITTLSSMSPFSFCSFPPPPMSSRPELSLCSLSMCLRPLQIDEAKC